MGPSDDEIDLAIDELRRELESPEMVDRIRLDVVPDKKMADASIEHIAETVVETHDATMEVTVGEITAKLYLVSDLSPNDPYVAVDPVDNANIVVVVNRCHPHFASLGGSEGVLNYLRHCTYDALSEWKAMSKAQRLDPNTIKLIKDGLLRVPFEIVQQDGDS